jgi:hypothetical protein
MPETRKPAKTATKRVRYRRWTYTLDVVGLKFRWKRDGRRAIANMVAKKGNITGMRLIREPDNPYDAAAIMVCLPERIIEGKQLGYIRTEAAQLLAPRLDSGKLVVLSAKLTELDESQDWNVGELEVIFGDVVEPAKRKNT